MNSGAMDLKGVKRLIGDCICVMIVTLHLRANHPTWVKGLLLGVLVLAIFDIKRAWKSFRMF